MAYEKIGFSKGQTLEAEHLNHMEEGIFNISNIFILSSIMNENGNEILSANMTYDELFTAINSKSLLLGFFRAVLYDNYMTFDFICDFSCENYGDDIQIITNTDMLNMTAHAMTYFYSQDGTIQYYMPGLGGGGGWPD